MKAYVVGYALTYVTTMKLQLAEWSQARPPPSLSLAYFRQSLWVTLLLLVYRQSFRLGDKPLETHDQHFFNWTLVVIVLGNNLSDERIGLSLMNRLRLSSSVRIAHIACYWKNLAFALHTNPLSAQALQSRSCLSYILCYNGSLVTRTVVSLTTAKLKPLISSMFGFTLSYTANMFMLMIP
jgi:hypothetical protein